ncbi:MAG: hypothetical protein V1944_00600 [Candidatus Aenigmatarchaeota archaeon]
MVSKQNLEILVVLFAGAFVLVAVAAPMLPGFGSLGGTQAGVIGSDQNAVFCSDSDGGINFDIRGTCTDLDSGNEYSDYCTGNVITEYRCSESGCTAVDFRCPYGCSQGRCLPQLVS